MVKILCFSPFLLKIDIESNQIHDRFVDSIPKRDTISEIIINLFIEISMHIPTFLETSV